MKKEEPTFYKNKPKFEISQQMKVKWSISPQIKKDIQKEISKNKK